MVESVNDCARAWDQRWQAAVVRASGPVRTVRLTRGELLKPVRAVCWQSSEAFLRSEVVLGGEAIPCQTLATPSGATRQ